MKTKKLTASPTSSKETLTYLATRPNRFNYVHTPKHGSWLNLIEKPFGKMACTFLRHVRVVSKAKLKECILQGIAEINADPIVHRWPCRETKFSKKDLTNLILLDILFNL